MRSTSSHQTPCGELRPSPPGLARGAPSGGSRTRSLVDNGLVPTFYNISVRTPTKTESDTYDQRKCFANGFIKVAGALESVGSDGINLEQKYVDTPSPYPCFSKNRNAPAICSHPLWVAYRGRRRRGSATSAFHVGLRGPKPGRRGCSLLGNGIFGDDSVASRLCDGSSGHF
ncbi:uncharacterized protein ATNIH1004_002056 [Aspergillus tanneri]|uniref:Uncharacterized protein n=1 Tax=Aspergillus tanneri TaxID=1220188 RepID=A0A5M9M6W2_9EURO|nr:uncharacterized protein ATNIH1004_002056 [Aspergillus tanneri]KAA8641316.1 hypothetical protein ATNIH1004_002056 [Aspergillus tanneri]